MATFNPAHRATYTPAQIQQYYERINLPASHRSTHVSPIARTAEGLAFLALLQKHQLASVPFESLELHYSAHHTISLEPQHLFHKIVERDAGRGGYCMENSTLFGTVLRSLGFEVKSVGAKVNEAVQPMAAGKGWKGPVYDGWNHMLNIVTIAGTRYLLDVGFGSSGPHQPLPLLTDIIYTNVGIQEMQLLYAPIPDFSSPDPTPLWQYRVRHTLTDSWLPAYAFSEMEYTPRDFMMMNYFTSTHRTSWFTYSVVCVKMLLDEKTGEIVGDVTLLGNEVKRRVKGKSETLAVCASEEERVEALEKWLGVKLSEAEKVGIKGMITEIL